MVKVRSLVILAILFLGMYLIFEPTMNYRGVIIDLSIFNLNLFLGIFLIIFGISSFRK